MAENLQINPWKEMWTRPRETIRAIVSYDPKYRFIVLSGLYGLPVVFQAAQNWGLSQTQPLWAILLVSLILCVFVGMLGITIASGLLYWTGSWIGGKGTYLTVRSSVSWSNITNIVNIALWLLLIVAFKDWIFMDTFAQSTFTKPQTGLVLVVFLTQFVIAIWSFILLLQSLAEVQGFSVWKALLNIIVSFGLVIVGIWILGLVFG